jgi:hypothetical protein
MTDKIEVRGWKEICTLIGVKDWRTARDLLNRHGLLAREKRTPVLNIASYIKISTRRHFD